MFTKAKIKRFNELEGCAPPVGTYDPKNLVTTLSPGFMKSGRFKNISDMPATPLPSLDVECTRASVKKSGSFLTPSALVRTHSTSSLPLEYTKIQECEKEIRRLLSERSDLLKQLAVKEGELKKLEGRLHVALRDRSHSQASAVLFEKKSKELGRINEILKMKLSTIEESNKKKSVVLELANLKGTLLNKDHTIEDLRQDLASVKQEHDNCGQALLDKNKEILAVKDELMSTLLSMETKLKESEERIFVLEDEKNILVKEKDAVLLEMQSLDEKLLQCKSLVTNLTRKNDELVSNLKSCQTELEVKQQQMDKLSEELRSENVRLINRLENQTSELSINKLLTIELDNAYQKLASTEDCSRALQDYKDALSQRIDSLKDSVNELESQRLEDIQTIKHLKLELMDVSSQLSDKEQSLIEASTSIVAKNVQIEELKLTKEQLLNVTIKCQQLEEELVCCQSDKQTRVDGLEVELLVAKLTCQTIETDLTEMNKTYSEMQEDLKSKSEEFSRLKKEFDDQQEISVAKEQEMKDIVETLQKDLCHKDEELQKLDCLLQLHTGELKSLQEKLKIEGQEKENMLQVIEDKSRDLRVLNEKLQQTEIQKEELSLTLEKCNSELVSIKREMHSSIADLENELKVVKEESDIKTKEFNTLAENCKQKEYFLQSEMQCLNKSLEQLTDDLSKIRDEKEKLITLLEEREKALRMVNEEFEISGRVLAECQQERDECRIAKEDLMENVKNLQIQLSMLKSESEELTKILETTKKEISNVSSECENHKMKVSEVLEEKISLQEQVENKSRELEIVSEALSSRVVEVEVANKKLKEKMDELDGVAKTLKATEEQVIALTRDNEQAVGLQNTLKDQCELMNEQIQGLCCEMENVRTEKDLQISRLSELVEQVQKEKQILKDQLLEANGMNNDTLDRLNHALQEMENLKSSLTDSMSKISHLESKSSQLTDVLRTKEMDMENLHSDLLTKTNEIDQITSELQKTRAVAESSEEEAQSLRESLERRLEEISELQTVIENNHKLMSENQENSIIEDLRTTTEELSSLQVLCEEQKVSITSLGNENKLLKEYTEQLETKLERQVAQREWFFNREKDLLREINIVEQQAEVKQQEFVKMIRDAQKQFAALQTESESYKTRKEKEGRQNEEMLQALTTEYESRMRVIIEKLEDSSKDSLHWKTLYEELKAKVAPFQDQLDAYEIERNVLMSKNNETMSDFHKLSQQYANLLGHQNHKQKIHYVYKLKEETLQLKEENVKLRTEVMKMKKALQQRRDISGSTRKFDPSKAFMHPNKENDVSFRDALSITNK